MSNEPYYSMPVSESILLPYVFKTPNELLQIARDISDSNSDLFRFDIKRYMAEKSNKDYRYGCMELNKGNFGNAFKTFERLAFSALYDKFKIVNVLAGIKLAEMYYLGDGVKVSEFSAAQILVSLIPYNNPLVFAWISELFRFAIPDLTKEDKLLSKKIFQKCYKELNAMAMKGNPDALYFVGFNLLFGINCVGDTHKGLYYLSKAAEAGNIRAKVQVDLICIYGIDSYIQSYGRRSLDSVSLDLVIDN